MAEIDNSPIVPFSGGEPGGAPPPAPRHIPYEGGHVVVQTPEALVAAKASQEFTSAFENVQIHRGKGILLDPNEAQSLEELRREHRRNRPKPATVINLHPWPLSFSASDIYMRGIVINACNPGESFAHGHIRKPSIEWRPTEDGTRVPKTIYPIQKAGQFVREFANQDHYGGGIIIYTGELHPDNVKEVETYDSQGRPITQTGMVKELDDDDREVLEAAEFPIMRPLADVLLEERKKRNDLYMKRVQAANHDYNLPNGKGKANITPFHMLMAEVLVAEGILDSLPVWKLGTREDKGMSDKDCPACGNTPKAGVFKCLSCGHILDALSAYMNYAIEYGHMSMESLTSDELNQATEERDRRRSVKKEASEKKKKQD